jgi:hypothetical protein
MQLSNLLVCQFPVVDTMDTTIPPKIIIIVPPNNKSVHLLRTEYLVKMTENNWVIRESKNRMGPIASNQLILNTCHSTSIMNATKKLPPTTVP